VTQFVMTRASGELLASQEFSTSFDATENPLGAPWIAPLAAGFTVMRSSDGHAYGTNGITDTYDDSYAYLSGFNPTSHECELIVYKQGTIPAVTHEIELHCGMSDDADTDIVKSYEALLDSGGSLQLMKWNGTYASGAFFFALDGSGPGWGGVTQHGEKMRLRKVNSGGNVILTIWKTPVGEAEVQVFTATDDGTVGGPPHLGGQPGIAAFYRPGANQVNYGAQSYIARNV